MFNEHKQQERFTAEEQFDCGSVSGRKQVLLPVLVGWVFVVVFCQRDIS